MVEECGEDVRVLDRDWKFGEDVLVAKVALLKSVIESARVSHSPAFNTYDSVVNLPSL